MEIDHLVRDGDAVKDTLKVVDGSLLTMSGCKIYFPKYYVDGKLGNMIDVVQVIGYYAIVLPNNRYAVNKTAAMITLHPDSITTVKFGEHDYLELTFHPGTPMMRELSLVRSSSLLFKIYDEIVAKGKTPWYLSYADLGAIFDSSIVHAGTNLKASRSILEMMAATRARDPRNRADYYRNMLTKQSDLDNIEPDIIPLRNIAYGATNAVSKLLGAYLNEGISSAIVNSTDRLERVEKILLS
jgi:hypothetical protein